MCAGGGEGAGSLSICFSKSKGTVKRLVNGVLAS